jgi:hypothetical protein
VTLYYRAKGDEGCMWQLSTAAMKDVSKAAKGKQPSKPMTIMTQANPKFVMSQPMLTADELHKCHTPISKNETEVSIRVPRMFKSHI